jgi:hypothetical protein
MAIGTRSDFKIYDEQYFGGQFEKLTQNLNLFNGASNGAFTLSSSLVKGDYERESFMAMVAGLIQRRDPTVVTGVADSKLTQGERVGVKVNKRIGPVAQTLDAWKKINEDPKLFSFYLGQLIADQKLQNMVNTAIAAVEAALQGQANLVTTTAATITHGALVDGMAKFGDQAGNISCFVMHSKPYFDLVKQSIVDKIFGVANVAIYAGTVATFGKPTVVIDAPALLDAGAPNTYNTLGLVRGAVEVKESELETVEFQLVTGLENLVYRLQGEYAYNLRMLGMTWDVANGGANPDDTALATPTNWDKVATSDKSLPGVRLVTQ